MNRLYCRGELGGKRKMAWCGESGERRGRWWFLASARSGWTLDRNLPGRSLCRGPSPARPVLTADQTADADRIRAALLEAAAGDLRQLAETLAAATDETTFGATEFVGRDLVLGIGAKENQAAGRRPRKKATTVAAAGARPATNPPSSSGFRAAPS